MSAVAKPELKADVVAVRLADAAKVYHVTRKDSAWSALAQLADRAEVDALRPFPRAIIVGADGRRFEAGANLYVTLREGKKSKRWWSETLPAIIKGSIINNEIRIDDVALSRA